MIPSISFKAKYISSAEINERKLFKKTFSPKTVSFAELEPDCKNDLKALAKNETSKGWGQKDSLSKHINEDINIDAKHIKEGRILSRQYYAIVDDTNLYEIIPKKILALAEIENMTDNHVRINYIQVKPEYTNDCFKKNSRYKHIGTALLSEICRINKDKNITLVALPWARDFYKRFGFKDAYAGGRKMILKASKFMKSP